MSINTILNNPVILGGLANEITPLLPENGVKFLAGSSSVPSGPSPFYTINLANLSTTKPLIIIGGVLFQTTSTGQQTGTVNCAQGATVQASVSNVINGNANINIPFSFNFVPTASSITLNLNLSGGGLSVAMASASVVVMQ